MPKITAIRLGVSRLYNLGNYESVRIEAVIEASPTSELENSR